MSSTCSIIDVYFQNVVDQGSPNYGSRAKSGPPVSSIRPATNNALLLLLLTRFYVLTIMEGKLKRFCFMQLTGKTTMALRLKSLETPVLDEYNLIIFTLT